MTTRAKNWARPPVSRTRSSPSKKRAAWITFFLMAAIIVGGGAIGIGIASWSNPPDGMSLSALLASTHVHGIAVDANDPKRVYLATHNGFFVVTPDGKPERVSGDDSDYMGFTPHPKDPATFFVSGHPRSGGNLGFMSSMDGGKSWHQLAKGANGPVDFHQMDVSKADPNTIYGFYRGLQVSRDGGRSWQTVDAALEDIIDLAASARSTDTLYAATRDGLLISRDGGKSWQPAHPSTSPVTMVRTTADRDVYAYVIGTGLVRAREEGLNWAVLGNSFAGGYVLHLAVDPSNKERLYAATLDPATHRGDVLTSADAGRSWSRFGAR